ncbi:MAG: penicillin-binding transpeptidase domain-containing protein [Bacteroidota bacterium]|jgi:beta-lactamase class D
MRKRLLTALLLCLTLLLGAQEFTRHPGENSLALIKRLSPGDSLLQNMHTFKFRSGDTSVVFFFKQSPAENGAVATVLHTFILIQSTHAFYCKPDTLAAMTNCFAPASIDSVFTYQTDKDTFPEVCFLLGINPYCDAYISTYSLAVYEDVKTIARTKQVVRQTRFNQSFFKLPLPRPGELKADIEKHFDQRHPLLPPVMRDDLKYLYDSIGVDGCFVLYDPQMQQYTYVNKNMATWQLTPASTFKICNTLIGLETGVLKDEQQVFEWDGKKHQNPNWNKTQNLQEAYKNSTVWYYQELARRVGSARMKMWLDSCGYGNADTTGGLTQFWLTGKLRITAEQQTEFLQLLHEDKLPFSRDVMGLTKEIMIDEMNANYTSYGKTGWGYTDSLLMTGWFVGYVEVGNKVYYFANLLTTSTDYNNPHFKTARKALAYRMLREMNVIPRATN